MIKIFIRHGQCISNLQDKTYSFSRDEQDTLIKIRISTSLSNSIASKKFFSSSHLSKGLLT